MIRRHRAPALIASLLCLPLGGLPATGDQAPSPLPDHTSSMTPQNHAGDLDRTPASPTSENSTSRPVPQTKVVPNPRQELRVDPKQFALPKHLTQPTRPIRIPPKFAALGVGLAALLVLAVLILPFLLIVRLVRGKPPAPSNPNAPDLSGS
jgi:hypothetical protein